jgi:hypothetical protein
MNDIQSIGRKITIVLFAEQGLASAALIAAATLNSIVGAKLAGTASLAGLPRQPTWWPARSPPSAGDISMTCGAAEADLWQGC